MVCCFKSHGNTHLALLFQKAMDIKKEIKHPPKKMNERLLNNVTPFSLRINKAPAIKTVNEDFHLK